MTLSNYLLIVVKINNIEHQDSLATLYDVTYVT